MEKVLITGVSGTVAKSFIKEFYRSEEHTSELQSH